MSITFDSSVYVVEAQIPPEHFESADRLDAFLRGRVLRLTGATRYGWMHWILSDVCAGYGLKNLGFMGLKSGDTKLERIDLEYHPDGPYAHYYVSVLAGNKISAAIDDIDRLFALVIEKTAVIAKVMKDHNDAEDIVTALKGSSISGTPQIEVGDEGEGAWYFFTYLRTLKSVLEAARLEAGAVIYIQEVPA